VLKSALFHEPLVAQEPGGVVVVRDIDFASTCETSLLPFHGRVHIGYLPRNGIVLGLSKMSRLTSIFARRLQTQERLAAEVSPSHPSARLKFAATVRHSGSVNYISSSSYDVPRLIQPISRD
jgi:GTP cyclohydrolase I